MSSEPIPHGTTLIVRGGRALLPGGNWHEPEALDIAVAGDTIAGVAGRFAPAAGTPIEELDARGHLVLPGFVNAHYHSHDVLAKGTLEEVPLETWRLYALPPQYPPRSVEEVRARTLLGALECLRSGMTTIQDMLTLYPFDDRHLDAVMRAYDEIGIRVVFSLQYADRKGLETIPYWKDIFPQDLHPLLSTAAEPERQLDLLGHFEATWRGVRHVVVDGTVVVRDRRLTTIAEDDIYDAVEAVMPGFRRDFAAISERVKRLQPWLDQAHQRIVSTEIGLERIHIPF
jgi:5-methylthioadenosine/S-adenosylhomocysteine deaminase